MIQGSEYNGKSVIGALYLIKIWNSLKQERKPKDGSIKKKESNKSVTAGTGEKSNEGPSIEGSEDKPKGSDQQQEEKEKKNERPKLDVTKVERRNAILLSVLACIPSFSHLVFHLLFIPFLHPLFNPSFICFSSPFHSLFASILHPLCIPFPTYHRYLLLTDDRYLAFVALFLFLECRYFQLHNTYLN